MNGAPIKRVSQEFLNDYFNMHVESQLTEYRSVEFYNKPTPPESGQPWGTSTVGIKYYDQRQVLCAVIFYYRKPDGTLGASGKPIPKGLLIDGIWHYV
jgi:hypothetical protein